MTRKYVKKVDKDKPHGYNSKHPSKPFFNYIKQPRKCLACGKPFDSQHSMNRVCWKCKQSNATEWANDCRYTEQLKVNL